MKPEKVKLLSVKPRVRGGEGLLYVPAQVNLTGVRPSEKTVSEDYILCGSICMTFQKEKKTNYSFKK